jgi:integrase
MTGETQLESAKNNIWDSEKLSDKEKQVLAEDFLHELRQGEPISSSYTLAKHLRKIRNIAENIDWSLVSGDLSARRSKEIRRQIQNSEFKRDLSKSNEYSEKNKKDHWTAYKYFLKHVRGVNNLEGSELLPPASFSSNEEKVDKQALTDPHDLPNREQFRKLLKTMQQQSSGKVADRNVAFFSMIWDTGVRAGEALATKIRHVEISNGNMYIDIQGNKKSKDRPNRIYQCEKVLKTYYKNHPALDNPDAYLFPKTHFNEYEQHVTRNQMAEAARQAKRAADLDFKLYGEPIHIFRKAMSTFLSVNGIMEWETIASRQGKKGNSTKPDYVLQAEDDREIIEAKGFGLDPDQEEAEKKGHMAGRPLMPQKCSMCSRRNSCLQDECVECEGELEYSTLPGEKDERQKKIDRGVEILEDRLEKFGEL